VVVQKENLFLIKKTGGGKSAVFKMLAHLVSFTLEPASNPVSYALLYYYACFCTSSLVIQLFLFSALFKHSPGVWLPLKVYFHCILFRPYPCGSLFP
jgi:hypothetical protein